jgi:hypothetical protein
MIEYKRHFPAFFDRDPEPSDGGKVHNLEELLALPCVAQWKDGHQSPADPNQFDFFCWSDSGSCDVLMAQMRVSHWVILFMRGDREQWRETLPEWKDTSAEREARARECNTPSCTPRRAK